MKQNIYIICLVVFSIFIVALFMEVTEDKEIIPVMIDSNSAKLFKTGTYNTKDEAEKEASLKKGIVMEENDTYNVYISILKNASNIERMINYLDENNIYYNLIDIQLDSEFVETLNKYEELMNNSTSTVAFLQLNKKILERYAFIYES
ncbi:MAG: hypothetical protein J1F35_00900 [Erysipelotrichales bacterium]|nr:hypothetical protein [Erysipelotrichales bacterium]